MTENLSDPDAVKAAEKRIAEIKALLANMEANLVKLIKAIKADGIVKPEEKVALDRYKAYMTGVKDNLLTAEYKLAQLKQPFMDPNAPKKDPKLGTQLYFTDSILKSAFKGSIKNWTQDQAIGLNSVRTYMIEQTKPAGLNVHDVVSVVLIIFPPGKAIEGIVTAAKTLAPIVEKAFNTSFGSTKNPSLNEIHVAWSSALAALAKNESAMDDAYDHFVADWKKKNGIDKQADWVWSNTFLPDCRTFADHHMPSGAVVQKAFLAKIISVVEDSNDWDYGLPDGMADAGTLELHYDNHGEDFKFRFGQLDDVPSGLMKAIKTVYKGASVVDLPVAINTNIYAYWNGAHSPRNEFSGEQDTTVVRMSTKPGNRGFKMTRGSKTVFKRFMATNPFDKIKVKDLSVDT